MYIEYNTNNTTNPHKEIIPGDSFYIYFLAPYRHFLTCPYNYIDICTFCTVYHTLCLFDSILPFCGNVWEKVGFYDNARYMKMGEYIRYGKIHVLSLTPE